jgi:hypothetical protein
MLIVGNGIRLRGLHSRLPHVGLAGCRCGRLAAGSRATWVVDPHRRPRVTGLQVPVDQIDLVLSL